MISHYIFLCFCFKDLHIFTQFDTLSICGGSACACVYNIYMKVLLLMQDEVDYMEHYTVFQPLKPPLR
jgi:hypothetical protein